jgi:2-succinyl-5-enolpyruvyl-6-hydroxy-3-cyclohexene-1-carboxylate synthase
MDRESIAAHLAIGEVVLPAETLIPITRDLSDSTGHSLREVGKLLSSSKRPVIVCGPSAQGSDHAQSVIMLAERIGAPILADIASQLRGSKDVISYYDFILRDEDVRAKVAPDVILRIGALPTSKALNEWIVSSPAIAKIGIADGVVADPGRILTHSVRADCHDSLRLLLDVVSTRLDYSPAYRNMWKGVDGTVATLLKGSPTESAELLESGIVSRVCSHIGSDSNLFLSNSMPIRWADMYAKARDGFPPVFVNRGANGIDGIVSTAAGVARASRRTTICVLGDLTFLHDQNGLWRLADDQVPLKMILLNNSGGGVFHFLPIASHVDHFERLVAMPHNIDLAQLVSAHGIRYWRSQSLREFSVDFEECLRHSGPAVLEVRTDRALNYKRHMETVATATRAIRESLRIL